MTRTTVPYPPHGSDEWHRVRWADQFGQRRIPASSAACLFDAHDYQTAGEFAAVMLAPDPPSESRPTMAQERGHRLEEPVALWWSDLTGHRVAKPEVLYVNGRVIATIDYEIPGTTAHLEVKTDAHRRWNGMLPAQWRWQGVAQAYARGSEQVEWAILDADQLIYCHTQPVTADDLATFEARVAEWCAWIDLGMAPEGVEMSYDDQATRWPQSQPPAVVLPPEAWALHQERAALEADIKQRKARVDEIKAWFAERLGDHEAGALGEGLRPIVTWRTEERHGIDRAALTADHPDLAAKYETTTTSRVMRFGKGE